MYLESRWIVLSKALISLAVTANTAKLICVFVFAYETSSPKGNDRSPENKQVFSNSSLVSKRFFQLVKGSQLCSPWLNSIKGRNSVANLQQKKMTLYNPNVDLVKDNVYSKFG